MIFWELTQERYRKLINLYLVISVLTHVLVVKGIDMTIGRTRFANSNKINIKAKMKNKRITSNSIWKKKQHNENDSRSERTLAVF